MTAEELFREAPADPEWIVEGIVERGGRTLLPAEPKAGKSTLAFALAGAVTDGRDVLGLSTSSSPVIYCTEEGSSTTLRSKVDRFGLQASTDFHILKLHKVLQYSWRETVGIIAETAIDTGAKFVVIDVLHNWARFSENQENDSGAVTGALRELDRLTTLGVGVLVLTHSPWGKKRARGSTGITGDADAIFTLQRPDSDEPLRTLEYLGGRYDEAPDRLTFRLSEDGLEAVGKISLRSAEVQARTIEAVRELGNPTADEVAAYLELSPSGARARLKKAAAAGLLVEQRPSDNRFPMRWSVPTWGNLMKAAFAGEEVMGAFN